VVQIVTLMRVTFERTLAITGAAVENVGKAARQKKGE
jgi:hypothetical protein